MRTKHLRPLLDEPQPRDLLGRRIGRPRTLTITPLGHAVLEHPCRDTSFAILEVGVRAQCKACDEVIEVER